MERLFTAHIQMTGLHDLHFDYEAYRILIVIEESSHIKHFAKGK